MAVSMPSWAIPSQKGEKKEGGTRGGADTDLRQSISQHKSNGELDLKNLLATLTKMSLMNAESVRGIAGAIFLSLQIPAEGMLCKT